MAGHILAVVGGKGGVGKSVFAANLMLAYLQEFKQRPLLIDADLQACGDQNLILGQTSPKNIVELSKAENLTIDPRSLSLFLLNASAGYSYLSAPKESLQAQDIHLEGLGRFLKNITQIFPWVIIDCGPIHDPVTLKVLEFSTLIFTVSTMDVIGVNQTKRVLSSIAEKLYPAEMVQLILNRYSAQNTINPSLIQKNLNKQIFAAIPDDHAAFDAALAKNQPLLLSAAQSNAAKAIRETARKVQQNNLLDKISTLLKTQTKKSDSTTKGNPSTENILSDGWTTLKLRLHKELIDKMDLKKMNTDMNDAKQRSLLREKTQKTIIEILELQDTQSVLQNREQKAQIIKEVLDEALGLGPLEDLLADESVTEIMVNARNQIYIEKLGKPMLSKVNFSSETQMMNVIERIVTPLGRRVDEKVPYVDARLLDGSRVHVIIPPLALRGPTITIRKFPKKRIEYKNLIEYGSMTEEIADFLRVCVEAKINIVVSGGTGSGKTTLLNVLSNFIPATERIITVEDSAELQLGQEHVVRLESRPKNIEGEGEVSIRDLIKCCLRMRPDRIVVGECRSGEALDMLQAMNTGHSGSLTTLHSNNPRECIARLETLVMMAGLSLAPKAIRENIASAVGLIIQQSRLSDGSRKITYITEVIGMQGDVVSLQDIFIFKQEGLDKKRKVLGRFLPTGFIPKFVEDMEAKGMKISRSLFNVKAS